MTSALVGQAVLLDSVKHRDRKLQPLADFSITRGLHAVFLTATEFVEAARELPIIFIDNGEGRAAGKASFSPVALLGLQAGENLQLEGTRWVGRYLPAFVRRFPFSTGAVAGGDAPGVFVHENWPGFNTTEGEALFESDGTAAPALKRAIEFLERFDTEEQRTRAFCARLAELDVLKGMKADATLPNGETLSIDGFLAVDEDKLRALPDATVLELHRSGMLVLLHAHLLSLGTMRHLINRKAALQAATPTST